MTAPSGFAAVLERLAGVHQRLSAHLTGQDHHDDELTVAMLGGLMSSYLARA